MRFFGVTLLFQKRHTVTLFCHTFWSLAIFFKICDTFFLHFDTFEINDGKAAAKKLRDLSSDYGIIYITEKLAASCEKEIRNMKDNITPAVILIPGASGNTGKGMQSLNESVERAVGKNIL